MPENDGAGGGDLREVLAVLRRRKWTVVLATVTAVAAAVGLSFAQDRVYRAEAQVLLGETEAGSSVDLPADVPGNLRRSVQTEIQLLESVPVRDLVRQELGVSRAPEVDARAIGQSDVIELRSRSDDPQRAADVANAYANAYVTFRREREVRRLNNAAEELKARLTGLQVQIADLDARIAADGDDAADLRSQRDIVLQQQIGLTQRLTLLQAEGALDSSGAQVVAPAAVPTSPVAPRPVRNGVLALAIGLLAGVGIAFVREHLDDSLAARRDLAEVGPDTPVVGTVPKVQAWKRRHEPMVVTVADPHSPAAEAYRSLAASVEALGVGDGIRTLQVTSPTAGQGKTVTAANLSVALARSGRDVIAVCCDLRRPRLHEFFGLPNSPGLSAVLRTDWVLNPQESVLQPVPEVARLRFLGSGSSEDGEPRLLDAPRMQQLLRVLEGIADVVILDSPPLLGISDATVLAGKVDSTLVVTMPGATTRGQFDNALQHLQRVKGSVLGVVFNGVAPDDTYYGYAYYHGYRPGA